MKKIIGLFSIAIAFTSISCSNQPAETKKEVIVVPATTVVKPEPEKATSVTLDKNGVKVETKKVNVVVKPH